MNEVIPTASDANDMPMFEDGDWLYDDQDDCVGVVEDCVPVSPDCGSLVVYRDVAGVTHTIDGWPEKLQGEPPPWGATRLDLESLAGVLATAERRGFTHVDQSGDDGDDISLAAAILRALSGDWSFIRLPVTAASTFKLFFDDGVIFWVEGNYRACVLHSPSVREQLRMPFETRALSEDDHASDA